MPDGTDVICTFDGTFDGFLSVIYHTVKNRIRPVAICEDGKLQLRLNSTILQIPTSVGNAERVRNSIIDIMGYDGFRRAYYVFLNAEKESALTSYFYLLYGFKYGKDTYKYMSTPQINKAYKLERQVVYEVDRIKGFVRFSVMEGGVEYAQIEPENNILELIMPHFADRLKRIPFIIHDMARQKAGVCYNGSWFIADASEIKIPHLEKDEEMHRGLWKDFYNAICIRERRNLKLQTQLLPKKYRKHMTEFN